MDDDDDDGFWIEFGSGYGLSHVRRKPKKNPVGFHSASPGKRKGPKRVALGFHAPRP